jgi:dolichol-phosphate mannosyltransferase
MSVATSQPRVSIVVPTYDEKENISEFSRRLAPVTQSLGGKVGVVFVDDNSPDGTGAEIKALMRRSPNIRLIEREGKQGLGTAYLDGFRYAVANFDPDIVIQIDADLQHPPEMVENLVHKVAAGEADVAIASRHVKGGSFKGLNKRRKIVSRGASWLSRTILGLHVKDTTTGFKALSRRAVDTILEHPPRSNGFIFQVESLYILKTRGFKMVEVPFTFEERAKGASKMGTGEIWEFFLGVLSIRFRGY